MKRYSFGFFAKLSIKEQIDFLLEKNIFKIRDGIDEIIVLENDDIETIAGDSSLQPHYPYLSGIYHLMMKQLENYENETKSGNSKLYYKFKYEEKLEFSNSLNEHIKIAKKIRKKIIKSIKNGYFPFIIDLIPNRKSLKEDFKKFWFDEDTGLLDKNLVNLDVLRYATWAENTQSNFDCMHLNLFVNLVDLVSLYNALDYIENEIKILSSTSDDEYNFINNIKFNIQNNINRYDDLFDEAIMCELFIFCIKKEKKITSRKLNIYWYIFNQYEFRREYHGVDVAFISFCKDEFDIDNTRVEKETLRKIDPEMKNFKLNRELIFSLLQ